MNNYYSYAYYILLCCGTGCAAAEDLYNNIKTCAPAPATHSRGFLRLYYGDDVGRLYFRVRITNKFNNCSPIKYCSDKSILLQFAILQYILPALEPRIKRRDAKTSP